MRKEKIADRIHNRTIQARLFKSFEKHPDNIAIECEGDRIKYNRLDRQSNYIANWLNHQGITRGTFIGIMVDDKISLITIILAIIKAGCVFVPLDSNYPDRRTESMLLSSNIPLVFTEEEKIGKLKNLRRSVPFRLDILTVNKKFYLPHQEIQLKRYEDRYKLSEAEKSRYHRQMLLDGWGLEGQERLKASTVFVAGAGGSGSPLIQQLALCGFGTIIICDFDRVELSNLNRQSMHDESRIGMNKALSAKMTVERMNPNINVVPEPEKITRDNVFKLVGEAEIIFDNLDSLEAKSILSECAVAKGIPHIISSMIHINSYACIFHPPYSPCFHCLYDKKKIEDIARAKILKGSYEIIPNSVASPALYLSTGFAVNEAVKILLGLGKPAYNVYFHFNQYGSGNVVKTNGYRQITYPFNEHFRKISREQGYDWDTGWHGRYLEEIAIAPDPLCPVCSSSRDLEAEVENKRLPVDEIYDNKSEHHLYYVNPPQVNYLPGDKINIYFTSGTTGQPKAVLGKNEGMAHFISWEIKEFGITERTRVSQMTSQCHDPFLRDIFVPLCTGGTICVPDTRETLLDSRRMKEWLENSGVNLVHCTPGLFNIMNVDGLGPHNYKRLQYVLMAGEKILPQDLEKWYGKLGERVQLVNVYGPTETTLAKLFYPIQPQDALRDNIPIGCPIPGAKVIILDKESNVCGPGEVGEIYIRTPFRSYGYYNDTTLTGEKFIKNPFSDNPDDIIYKTGDLGKLNRDGNIEFVGREDRQVKIRGFRVELDEIEKSLRKYRGVREAVVLYRGTRTGNHILCAYFTGNSEVTVSGLKEFLNLELPDYMVPSFHIKMEKFPLNTNGKLNYRALPEPDEVERTSYIAPKNETEQKMVEIWAGILGIKKIGVHDGFLDMGGNSLNAMNLTTQVYKEFGVNLQLSTIFENPTVTGLISIIEGSVSRIYQRIEAVEQREYYALSSAQKRMYLLREFSGEDDISYNQPKVLELRGELDIVRLEEIFRRLLDRHEALRTGFFNLDSGPVQRIQRVVESRIEYYDLRVTGSGNKLNREELPWGQIPDPSSAIGHFIRPFDLSQAPLARVGVITLNKNRHLLMMDIHHIISDGLSTFILAEDFMALSRGGELEPMKLHYKDFSHWQNQLFAGELIKSQEEYWFNCYADIDSGDIPRLQLPMDFKRPGIFTFAGDNFSFALSEEESREFKGLGMRNGVTLYMNILTLLNTLFYRYTGQTDIIIGSAIAGRQHADLQGIMGMFVNTLAMRNFPRGEKTYKSFLQEAAARSVKAYENQDVQFEALVEKLELARDPSRNPLFDISMGLQDIWEPDLPDSDGSSGTGDSPDAAGSPGGDSRQLEILPSRSANLPGAGYRNPTAKFDMTFFIHERGETIHIAIEYYTAIYKRQTIERLSQHSRNILRTIIKNPGIRLRDIELISDEEREEVLCRFNDTKRDYPVNMTIPALFVEQVEKTPDRIALVHEDRCLSYGQLHREARQLANYLVFSRGVQLEDVIGILMERSIDQVIALLGILKAGAAYLPIDSSLPGERIRHMLDDAGVGIVIAQKKFIRTLNRLQWECSRFHTFVCPDSIDIYEEEEVEKSELMEERLWDYVAESSEDDITGGGWFTSYTGEPFSREEMDEYGDNILEKLRPLLHKEMRVLEIGCGSGISLYRLAPLVGEYYATDLSRRVIEKNQKRVREQGQKNIIFSVLAAHEIDRLERRDFDLVIINSVVQSFHGLNYLGKVIRKAIKLSGKTGYIFIGDILDQDLKKDLIREMVRFKAGEKGTVKTKIDWSADLFVSKKYFSDLKYQCPEISNLEYSKKIHTIENELTRFRYDILLTIDNSTKSFCGGSRGAVFSKRAPLVAEGRKIKYKYQDDITTIKKSSIEPLKINLHPGNSAYIIYTSGSTGLSKGVIVQHGNVVRLVKNSNYIDYMGIKKEDRFLLTGAFSFDISTFEIWGILLNGIEINMTDKEVIPDARQLREVVVRHRITLLHMIPQLLNHQLEGCPGLFGGLSCLLAGGDMVNPGPVGSLRNMYRGLKILHMYGPTENTTFTTYFPVEQDYEERIPIGGPISNSTVYILDKCGSLQPVGVNGEICAGGAGVARGYLNNPGLTQERFVNYKLQKLYKTGDLGRWLPGGNIEFSGRIDSQVKIRGFRIELGEIENQLMKYPGIRDAVVTVRESEGEVLGGDRHLCAYIIGISVDIMALREYLSRVLPDYTIPSYFMSMEHFPLTTSGKVNRQALPSPEAAAGETYAAPRNKIEKRLEEIWWEVLGRGKEQVSRIGIDDSFFNLGGHSLSAALMTSKIHKEFQVKFSLARVFKTPSIRELAKHIENSDKTGQDLYIPIKPVEKKEYYPVSFQQKRLWILRQLEGDNVSYHMPMRIELAQAVDEAAVRKSLQMLAERHESLRTAFIEKDGIPFQVIVPRLEILLKTVDISGTGAEGKQSERERLFREAAVTVFDFTRAPLFRAVLIKCEDSRYDLVIVMHHIITDGWSMQILEREFSRFYETGELGKELVLEPLSIQYKDFCQWDWDTRGSGTLEQEQASRVFWLKHIGDGLPLYRLPVDYAIVTEDNRGACFQCYVDEGVKNNLMQLARENNTTLSMVMFTIYNILVAHLANQEDIVCSLISANREHASVHEIVGYFINSVLIKIHADPEADFDVLLGRVHGIVTETLEHQHYPVELALDELGMSYPGIPVSFNMLNLPGESILENSESMETGDPLSFRHLDRVHGVKFDLGLVINESIEGIELLWNYKKALFRSQTIESVARMYMDLLEELSR